MAYEDCKPISEKELEENRKAIIWLHKHGVTDYEIRFFRWRYFDYDHKKIMIDRCVEKGSIRLKYQKKIPYHNSPLEDIANRNNIGQRGKNIYVFYQTQVSPRKLTDRAKMYHDYEIQEICAEKKSLQIWQGKSTKALTFSLKFANIEVSKDAY